MKAGWLYFMLGSPLLPAQIKAQDRNNSKYRLIAINKSNCIVRVRIRIEEPSFKASAGETKRLFTRKYEPRQPINVKE